MSAETSRSELAKQIFDASSLTGEFVLRSGQVSQQYFDKYRFEGKPEILRPLAKEMASLLPAGTEIVAGLELGGVPLVTAISLETGLPAAFIRKEAKSYGTCKAIEGQDVGGRKVTFIEDVITTGGAVSDAYKLATEEGALVLAVVCALWRGDGDPAIVSEPSLPVFPAFRREDLVG
ncbi:orotate phosphoribosyltransferase [Aliiroseovarius crassostreae]|uniref:orotate phosphoribosyltransferase n=1 Tax=Aliiroseovarius crassostreae TaxID=154981 RepID=UPI0021AF4B98|nr:orotate phosphoribosyltransferase [Aliiroseovarius crassostreae]UWP89998.1 orotate phosphoribosyltransferase [Aliiroseovarius crassostreae]UWQ02648.1 orotate phosphoribosyltransferase [Aliiroseovarius crassostreae]